MTPGEQLVFARNLVGKGWQRGATGPDAWDCGSLTAHVQRIAFGRELPVTIADYGELASAEALRRAIADADVARHWPVVPASNLVAHPEAPMRAWRHGDVLVLRRGDYVHVGTWFALGRQATGMLHCARHDGVVFQPVIEVKLRGWSTIEACRPRPDGAGAPAACANAVP